MADYVRPGDGSNAFDSHGAVPLRSTSMQRACLRVKTHMLLQICLAARSCGFTNRLPGAIRLDWVSPPVLMNISVWAPYAQCVELDLPGRRVAMQQQPHGWWSLFLDTDSPVEYAFVIDGSEPLPDPRSPWQPFGVHGPSRTVDHSAFHWTDAGWQAPPFSSAVVY